MAEGVLEREYVHAPLHSVCGMAVPQLVRVNVEAGGSSPLPANISNCLAREMSCTAGAREDESLLIAAAKTTRRKSVRPPRSRSWRLWRSCEPLKNAGVQAGGMS